VMIREIGFSMKYLKILAINFLVAFFSNYLLPGVEVLGHTKLPQVEGDLIYPFSLAVLNTAIGPLLKVFQKEVTALKIALTAFILNFAAYGIVKLLPVHIAVTSVEGYILVSAAVTLGGFLTNFFDMKRQVPPNLESV
jgi:hypothetical protein